MAEFALIRARTKIDTFSSAFSMSRGRRGTPEVEIYIPKTGSGNIALSIIIGSNGTGKTRLLSGIAEAFLQLDQAKIRDRSSTLKGFPLSNLEYSVGDNIYQFNSLGKYSIQMMKNGIDCEISEIELPTRVVALTVAPHDRFPLGRAFSNKASANEYIYRYMGLRDRSGRASMLAFLYSALENLLEDGHHLDGRRDKIVAVFNLLKYKPRFEITYSLRLSRSDVEEALFSERFIDHLPPYQQRRLREIIEVSSGGYADFTSSLAQIVDKIADAKYITVSADITDQDHGELAKFQMLRRAGVLSIRAIEIERHDGIFVDLKEASSGELSIAASFLALAGVLDDGSLVLIDEPEISLHPEWQSTYIDTLTSTFRGYIGCHYLIATHSPLIVSDAPQEATIYSLDKKAEIDGEDVSGGSTDRLLVQLFKTPTVNNLYLKQEIVSALRLAADGRAGTKDFRAAVTGLVDIGRDIDDGEPVKKVIDALANTLRASR